MLIRKKRRRKNGRKEDVSREYILHMPTTLVFEDFAARGDRSSEEQLLRKVEV
jgi:hypothetical protein